MGQSDGPPRMKGRGPSASRTRRGQDGPPRAQGRRMGLNPQEEAGPPRMRGHRGPAGPAGPGMFGPRAETDVTDPTTEPMVSADVSNGPHVPL